MSSASVSVFFPARSRRKQGEGSVSSVPVQSRAEQLCCMRTSGATLDPWHASGVIGGAPHHVAARTLSTSQHEPPCVIALPPPAVPAPPSAPRQRLGCTCGEQSRRHNTRPAQHGRTQQHELGPGSFPTQTRTFVPFRRATATSHGCVQRDCGGDLACIRGHSRWGRLP